MLAQYWTLRNFALLAFVIQHAFLTLGLRFSAIHGDPDNLAISSTEVFLTELIKLCLSILVSFCIDARFSFKTFFSQLEKAFVDEGADLLKLCIPAFLYTIQNNLQYVIETAPIFVVMYQMKIVTTAFFFSYMLQRRLTVRDWLTIIALALGVSMVQSSQTDVHIHHASNLIGVLSVFFACLTSGFAGVYFEKTLKASKSSIWMINIELSLLSTALSMFACLMEDTEEISRRGFFHGYNRWVILVIVLQAGAGLVVALVVKYADNIYKGFAASVSTVLASVMDYIIFNDTNITKTFFMGTIIIICSAVVFSYGQAKRENAAAAAIAANSSHSDNSSATNSMISIESGGKRDRLVSLDGASSSKEKAGGSPTSGGREGGESRGRSQKGGAGILSPSTMRWVQRLGQPGGWGT